MLERRDIGRLGAVFVFAAVAVLLILWRYISLMLLTPDDIRLVEPQASVERGPILDRNGRVLAIQTQLASVTAWVPDIEDFDATADTLATALSLDPETIGSIFETRPGFAYIKRKVSNSDAKVVESLIDEGRLPGIRLIEESARTYPEQRLAAPIVGIVDIDNRGLEGLELEYDETLLPEPTGSGSTELYGDQLFLTIDLSLQFAAERLAQSAREEHQADAVMLLAVDATNGDILAMAGVPSFNPNTFLDFPPENRINRPVVVAYEPGSVFKVFSMAAIMDIGGVTPSDTFLCRGYYDHPDLEEPIDCLGFHGEVGLTEIIKFSCNAGAGYASERVGAEEFYQKLKSFGFGTATSLDFPGESNGLFVNPSSWSARTKPTLAFGQEISVSAVQVVAAATALANDGVRLAPHIVSRVVSPDGQIKERYDRTPHTQVLSRDSARAMLLMMEQATQPGGTATRTRIDGVRISAKTGTAEVYNVDTGTYSTDQFIASCLAILPTEAPQAIVYAVIQNPQAGDTYGGIIAAPLVREMAEELVSYFGIPRADDIVTTHDGVVTVPNRPDIIIGDRMPDLTGYSKRELLPLLDIEQIEVTISGEGWVTGQYPPPGAPVSVGTIIEFILE